MKKEKQPEKIRQGIKILLDKYGQYINLSSVAMSVCFILLLFFFKIFLEIERSNKIRSSRFKSIRMCP
jgi:hypothetical protein